MALDLPGSVFRHEPESYDYLSARVAALRNHLHELDGKLWAFPLARAQPFILEAAYELQGSDMRCILWSIQPRSGGQLAHCEIYVVTLRCPAGPEAELALLSSELVARTSVPPQAVLVDAEADAFALVAAPLQAPAAAAGAAAPAGGAAAMEDDRDAVSPRTLQQAVARLAQFTSEGPPGGAAPMDAGRAADLFADHDPGDAEASLASEPDVSVMTFARLLAAHRTSAHALLGVVDDMDAVVVELRLEGSGGMGGAPNYAPALVQHVASVPALAYVAEGKVQRKAVLLGEPGAVATAAIVEGARLAFVYQTVSPGHAYGVHKVLDLQLSEGDAVVGAALVGGRDGSRQKLVVLTKCRLLWYLLE
ncbi:hypothetical protein WJX81_006769 [Elliptochloris bilobata]|uniref:Uncharacterized protein n=1 Tax=Elliptochloris bilobata TaxID=381761 RepID=A0AAW1R4F9_9CHLO